MTLDEAIQHCEITAKSNEKLAEFYYNKDPGKNQKSGDACQECAAEHRQLAEWLKELKQYREGTLFVHDWIPVSERLPENESNVLTTIQMRNGCLRVRSGWYMNGLFMNDNGNVWKPKEKGLKAWMYQPEPYRVNELVNNPMDRKEKK